jgi:hypothetical protein
VNCGAADPPACDECIRTPAQRPDDEGQYHQPVGVKALVGLPGLAAGLLLLFDEKPQALAVILRWIKKRRKKPGFRMLYPRPYREFSLVDGLQARSDVQQGRVLSEADEIFSCLVPNLRILGRQAEFGSNYFDLAKSAKTTTWLLRTRAPKVGGRAVWIHLSLKSLFRLV